MKRRTAPLAVALLVAASAMAGCSDPAPAPSPSGTGFATEAEAFAAAEATYRAYVDALNRVDLSDPTTFEDVYRWTTGDLNATDRENFSKWHANGYVIQGTGRIDSLALAEYDGSRVVLDSCYNVADVSVSDAFGVSVVSPERPDVQSLQIVLVRTPSHSDADEVLISEINPASEMTC